jgi:dienelactone hydrolase
MLLAWGQASLDASDSLKPLKNNAAPRTVEELWADYDPREEALEGRVVREWKEDGVILRYVTYAIGTFKGKPARMAAFYGFPADTRGKLPAVMHMHGGGQRANLRSVKEYAKRGYAALSVNWGGREMEGAKSGEENTDWGAVDPTQNNVGGYSRLLPIRNSLDAVESPRNNNWFLLAIGCRRGITFLEQKPEVDRDRIGIWGHSMGGRLTGLVAGTDRRVKAASPSVGGSGFLQTDMWGIPGSARRVSGTLELFRKTLAGQAYLSRVKCPLLFLSATNDFNAPLDSVECGMKLVPQDDKRIVYAMHFNHRFSPQADLSRRLWFDAHLRKRLTIPKSPQFSLQLKKEDGIPSVQVMPDMSREIARVDVYYGYDRDPRNRYWAAAKSRRVGNRWEAACPVFDLAEPLFVLANVSYRLSRNERHANDPETFLLSTSAAAHPKDLKTADVKATARHSRHIDDFSRGFQDWYVLNARNRHHWSVTTRKISDPRWYGPRDGRLTMEITTTAANNTLGVEIVTNSWRGYLKRKREIYTVIVPLAKSGKQRLTLKSNDFATEDRKRLADWEGITELSIKAGDKARPGDGSLMRWKGEVPTLSDLRWEGGTVVSRPKPYPQQR